jgi:hypothetical protein
MEAQQKRVAARRSAARKERLRIIASNLSGNACKFGNIKGRSASLAISKCEAMHELACDD